MKNYSEILEDRLENGPQNAKYTHHTIQDAILEIFSDITLDEITKEIKEAEYFALLVDETKDLSKQEQLTFVLRYVLECAKNSLVLELQRGSPLKTLVMLFKMK
jgi:hypothetical protein